MDPIVVVEEEKPPIVITEDDAQDGDFWYTEENYGIGIP